MRSSKVSTGDAGTAEWADNLRADAYGGSMLLAHEQTTPGLTLYVEPGVYYIGTTRVLFAGGSTPSFTAPTANPRIDLVTADSSGTLAIVEGTEAASPVAPSYPADKFVICEVYNVVGETTLYDNDNQTAGEGYILNDVRPLGAPPYISSTSQFGTAVVPDSALVSSFIKIPASSTHGDVLFFNGSLWSRLGAGTAGQVLTTEGSGSDPQWVTPNYSLQVSPVGGSGGTVLQDATNVESTSSLSLVKVKTLTCAHAGYYSFNLNLQISNTTATASYQLKQNGTTIASGSTQANPYTRLQCGTFLAAVNDTFDLYIATNTSSYSASTNSFQVVTQMGFLYNFGGSDYGFVPSLTVGSLGSPSSSWFTITLN